MLFWYEGPENASNPALSPAPGLWLPAFLCPCLLVRRSAGVSVGVGGWCSESVGQLMYKLWSFLWGTVAAVGTLRAI